MQKRKSEITLFSLLMCVLVIFIHVTSWTLTAMDKTSVKYLCLLFPWRLSAFVVQGFVFLSGVRLFLSKKPVAYGKFLIGRVRRIVLPYLVWVAVYMPFLSASAGIGSVFTTSPNTSFSARSARTSTLSLLFCSSTS